MSPVVAAGRCHSPSMAPSPRGESGALHATPAMDNPFDAPNRSTRLRALAKGSGPARQRRLPRSDVLKSRLVARVVKLVDTRDLKSRVRKDVPVRFRSRAPTTCITQYQAVSKPAPLHRAAGFLLSRPMSWGNHPTKKSYISWPLVCAATSVSAGRYATACAPSCRQNNDHVDTSHWYRA
jgi:hypothetical protein